jgi:hypothetical protein
VAYREGVSRNNRQGAELDTFLRLEAAGVEFIPENGGGAGVRLWLLYNCVYYTLSVELVVRVWAFTTEAIVSKLSANHTLEGEHEQGCTER